MCATVAVQITIICHHHLHRARPANSWSRVDISAYTLPHATLLHRGVRSTRKLISGTWAACTTFSTSLCFDSKRFAEPSLVYSKGPFVQIGLRCLPLESFGFPSFFDDVNQPSFPLFCVALFLGFLFSIFRVFFGCSWSLMLFCTFIALSVPRWQPFDPLLQCYCFTIGSYHFYYISIYVS